MGYLRAFWVCILEWLRRGAARLGAWLVAVSTPETVPDPPDPYLAAVCVVFATVGLPSAAFDPSFDLAASGKLNEVIHVAAVHVGQDHPLRTVHDVVEMLRRNAA